MAAVHSTSRVSAHLAAVPARETEDLANEVELSLKRFRALLRALQGGHRSLTPAELDEALFGLDVLMQDTMERVDALAFAVEAPHA